MLNEGRAGRTRWFPVVVGPPSNIVVLVVFLLQPLNERLEILHERLGAHPGLAGDHGHRLGPRLTEAELHHVAADRGRAGGGGGGGGGGEGDQRRRSNTWCKASVHQLLARIVMEVVGGY